MGFFEISAWGVVYRFSELLGAPFQNPGILWLGLPLLITLIVIELNISRSEEPKQALPNALVLFFVALDMMRVSFSSAPGFLEGLFSGRMLASTLVLLLGVVVFLIDYYWSFPSRKMLGFSAHLPVNTFAFALFVIVYNNTGFDLNSVIAIALFMALLALLFFLVSRMESGIDYSERGPSHKDIWKKRTKGREIEIVSKGSKAEPGDGDIVDPFRGVRKKKI